MSAARTRAWSVDIFAQEARAYWEAYLWHHRHPNTRLLHRIGSLLCIAGAIATLLGAGVVWLPLSIAIGYGFAFSGHYLVEGNRPLTLKHPLRAALCNWVLFFYEMIFDVEEELQRLSLLPPETCDIDSQ